MPRPMPLQKDELSFTKGHTMEGDGSVFSEDAVLLPDQTGPEALRAGPNNEGGGHIHTAQTSSQYGRIPARCGDLARRRKQGLHKVNYAITATVDWPLV